MALDDQECSPVVFQCCCHGYTPNCCICPFRLQAVKLGAVYPNKIWIMHGMEGGAWWNWEPPTLALTKCSNREIKQFLDKAITIVPLFDGALKGRQPTAANMKVYICTLYNISITRNNVRNAYTYTYIVHSYSSLPSSLLKHIVTCRIPAEDTLMCMNHSYMMLFG